jgi:hypothetical protein
VAQTDRRVAVDQNIRQLDVAVEQPRGAKIFEGATELPKDGAPVDVLKDVSTNHNIKVRLHQTEKHI